MELHAGRGPAVSTRWVDLCLFYLLQLSLVRGSRPGKVVRRWVTEKVPAGLRWKGWLQRHRCRKQVKTHCANPAPVSACTAPQSDPRSLKKAARREVCADGEVHGANGHRGSPRATRRGSARPRGVPHERAVPGGGQSRVWSRWCPSARPSLWASQSCSSSLCSSSGVSSVAYRQPTNPHLSLHLPGGHHVSWLGPRAWHEPAARGLPLLAGAETASLGETAWSAEHKGLDEVKRWSVPLSPTKAMAVFCIVILLTVSGLHHHRQQPCGSTESLVPWLR